jgi:tetratricopeptide (TPR) repeat protein
VANIEEAKRLYDVGVDDYRAGEYEEALEALSRARQLFAEAGDRKAESEALNDLGVVCVQLEEWDKAKQAFEEALTIRMTIQDRSAQGITLGNLGMMYERLDDEEKATEAYEQALAIFQELGETGNEKAVTRQLNKLKKKSLLDTLGGMLGWLTGGSDKEADEDEQEDVIDAEYEPIEKEQE